MLIFNAFVARLPADQPFGLPSNTIASLYRCSMID